MSRNRISTIIISFIFCFICSSFIVSNSYCSEDNPYCSGDQDRIQELTDEFIQKYGDEIDIKWSEDTGMPYTISKVYLDESEIDMGDPKGEARSFLSENESFLGLDIDDLKFQHMRSISNGDGYRVDFEIFYQGIRIDDNKVRVNIYDRENGKIQIYIKSQYIPCLDLDVDPIISSSGAVNIVKNDLGVSSLSMPIEPELIVFPKEDVYLAWKIYCHTVPFDPYYYYIDAHTGKIIASGLNRTTGPSENSTSSNSTTSNIYDIPYYTPYYNPYTPYNPIYTPYNTPYSAPYNNPYTPYNPISTPYNNPYSTPYNPYTTPYSYPIGGDWFSENYYNLIPNYNVFLNNNIFSSPW